MEVLNRTTESLRKMSDLGGLANVQRAADVGKAAIELGETQVFRTPMFRLDEALRERERILAPTAGGPMGAPYKMLRTQVLRRLDSLHANTLAVLSPASGAGKTLTAINLAIAIAAEAGRTALLVDLDLRRPSVARRFGLSCEVGIDDCLQSRRPIQDAMAKIVGYERLTLLPARERVENSSELLADRRCIEVITELRARYANRVVIFDLPPVLQADDALAIARHLQAGLIVVGEGRSRRDDLTQTLELLNDMTMVGTVLNGSREAMHAYY